MDDRQTIDNPAERPDSSDVPVESAIGLASDGHGASESHSPTTSGCASDATPDALTREESIEGVGNEPSPPIDPNHAASRENSPNPPESPVAPTNPAAEAEASLDQMRAMLDEVRTMVSDPSSDTGEILHAVCDDKALAEHGAEIDQLLNEFLDPNVSSTPAAAPRDSAVASADEALAAVETAMTSLSGAIESDGVGETVSEAEPDRPTESRPEPEAAAIDETSTPPAAVEAPAIASPEGQAGAAPPELDVPSDAQADSGAPGPAAQPESVPEPVAVAAAAESVVAVASAPKPAEPAKPAAAPAVPAVSAVRRMTEGATRFASTLSLRFRGALTGVASLLPQKFRMLGGVVALTLFVWVPVVWWMAKTIAANDRVRPLTESELHHLVESTHAAAAAGDHAAAKSEKKDEGHGEKSDKKEADHKPAKKDDGHAAKEAKKPAKDGGHGGGH